MKQKQYKRRDAWGHDPVLYLLKREMNFKDVDGETDIPMVELKDNLFHEDHIYTVEKFLTLFEEI